MRKSYRAENLYTGQTSDANFESELRFSIRLIFMAGYGKILVRTQRCEKFHLITFEGAELDSEVSI